MVTAPIRLWWREDVNGNGAGSRLLPRRIPMEMEKIRWLASHPGNGLDRKILSARVFPGATHLTYGVLFQEKRIRRESDQAFGARTERVCAQMSEGLQPC